MIELSQEQIEAIAREVVRVIVMSERCKIKLVLTDTIDVSAAIAKASAETAILGARMAEARRIK